MGDWSGKVGTEMDMNSGFSEHSHNVLAREEQNRSVRMIVPFARGGVHRLPAKGLPLGRRRGTAARIMARHS